MSIVNGYLTLAELKAKLWPAGFTADATQDTTLEDMITAASRTIDADTERRFWTTAADETRVFGATSFDSLCYIDIISITTLKTDDDGDGTFETTWATTDYQLYPLNAALDGRPYTSIHTTPGGSYTFPIGDYPAVQIVGKFGWDGSTVAEARTLTAPLAAIAYADNLASITALTTDGDANGSYETTWTVTTDYVATAVTGTPTTLIVASGAKTFPTAASGVKIVGTWNLAGAPAQIKEACFVRCAIESSVQHLFGGMGRPQETVEQMEINYQKLITPFKRFV